MIRPLSEGLSQTSKGASPMRVHEARRIADRSRFAFPGEHAIDLPSSTRNAPKIASLVNDGTVIDKTGEIL